MIYLLIYSKVQNKMKYVSFDENSQRRLKKEMLHLEAELLTAMKHYRNYKDLRNNGHDLKLLFRKKLQELQDLFIEFENALPQLPKTKGKAEDNLSSEINEIQKRISALNSGNIEN